MLRVYLDNCCYNRPFDDASSVRTRIEAEAKLRVQQLVVEGTVELAWSYVLSFESSLNPFDDRRNSIARWEGRSVVNVVESQRLLVAAEAMSRHVRGAMDCLHLAAAVEGRCQYFLTTDDRVLRKAPALRIPIRVMNPAEFVVQHDGGLLNDK